MQVQQLIPVNDRNNLIYHELIEEIPDKQIYCRVCTEMVSGSAYIDKRGGFYKHKSCIERITGEQIYCGVCSEVVSGSAYFDERRGGFGIHKSCAESPGEIQHHPLHPHHPLKAHYELYNYFVCDACRQFCIGVSYQCDDCDFKLDFECVSNPHILARGRVEISAHFHPEHKLQLLFCTKPFSNKFINDGVGCCFCTEKLQISAYACLLCNILIHEQCIEKVPLNVISPFHPQHPLFLKESHSLQSCLICKDRLCGVSLSCNECRCLFHISCCTNTASYLSIKFNCHDKHPMFYVNQPLQFFAEKMQKCIVCNTHCDWGVYCCLDCNVYVHIECIPLARVVKNVYHPYHPLTLKLSDPTHEQNVGDKCYHCVICEKKGYLKHPFYCCQECCDMAHVDCVLSEEEPLLEILEYLVPKRREASGSDQDDTSKQTEEDTNEVRTDLEDCSLSDVDERIATVQEKMDELALELGFLNKVRASKLKLKD